MKLPDKKAIAVVALAVCVSAASACAKVTHENERAAPAVSSASAMSAAPASAETKPTVLATSQLSSDRIVADATTVFWTTRGDEGGNVRAGSDVPGRIFSCPVAGCPAGPVLVVDGLSHLDAIAIDGSSVYWTILGRHGVPSSVQKCPRTGCRGEPTTIHQHPTGVGITSLAVDGARVFFTDRDDHTVKTCPADGCIGSPRVLARVATFPVALAVASGAVFWTNDDGSVMRCEAAGCDGKPTLIAPADGRSADVVTDGARVVWIWRSSNADGGAPRTELRSCPATGCSGAPSVLATSDGGIGAIALVSGRLYWARHGGSGGEGLFGCEVSDCRPTPVVGATAAAAIAATAAGLFWTNGRTHAVEALLR